MVFALTPAETAGPRRWIPRKLVLLTRTVLISLISVSDKSQRYCKILVHDLRLQLFIFPLCSLTPLNHTCGNGSMNSAERSWQTALCVTLHTAMDWMQSVDHCVCVVIMSSTVHQALQRRPKFFVFSRERLFSGHSEGSRLDVSIYLAYGISRCYRAVSGGQEEGHTLSCRSAPCALIKIL